MRDTMLQSRFLLGQAEKAFAGLEDDDRCLEPAPGVKAPGWLVGHLAITGDFGRRLAGRPWIAPKEWRALFSPGTHPATDPTAYPPMAELTGTCLKVYRDLVAHGAETPTEALDVENPYEPTRAAFPTAGDFLRYLMTGHFGGHIGQLMIWRAVAGRNTKP